MEMKKVWSSANIVPVPSGNDAVDVKNLFVQVKNAIVGFGHPVAASCNGTLVSESDVIAGPADIVTPLKDFARRTRRRCVGRVPPEGLLRRLCVEFNDAVYNKASFYVGGEFTGGSVNRRPRATDEVAVNRGPWWR